MRLTLTLRPQAELRPQQAASPHRASALTFFFSSFFALYLRSPDVQEKLQQERLWLLDTTAERTYAESAASAAGQLSRPARDPSSLCDLLILNGDCSRLLFYQSCSGVLPDADACRQAFAGMLPPEIRPAWAAAAACGFFRRDNASFAAADLSQHFVMCVPGAQSGAFASFINEDYTAFRQENYFDLSCGLNLYTCRERISLGEEYGRARAWVHVGQSSIAAGQQVQAYQRRLALVEEACRQGRRLTAENIAFLQENYRGGADADAAAKAAGLQLQREQYRQHLCGSGMFLMLSNCVEDKAQACHIYKTRARAAELLAAFRTLRRVKIAAEVLLPSSPSAFTCSLSRRCTKAADGLVPAVRPLKCCRSSRPSGKYICSPGIRDRSPRCRRGSGKFWLFCA